MNGARRVRSCTTAGDRKMETEHGQPEAGCRVRSCTAACDRKMETEPGEPGAGKMGARACGSRSRTRVNGARRVRSRTTACDRKMETKPLDPGARNGMPRAELHSRL